VQLNPKIATEPYLALSTVYIQGLMSYREGATPMTESIIRRLKERGRRETASHGRHRAPRRPGLIASTSFTDVVIALLVVGIFVAVGQSIPQARLAGGPLRPTLVAVKPAPTTAPPTVASTKTASMSTADKTRVPVSSATQAPQAPEPSQPKVVKPVQPSAAPSTPTPTVPQPATPIATYYLRASSSVRINGTTATATLTASTNTGPVSAVLHTSGPNGSQSTPAQPQGDGQWSATVAAPSGTTYYWFTVTAGQLSTTTSKGMFSH